MADKFSDLEDFIVRLGNIVKNGKYVGVVTEEEKDIKLYADIELNKQLIIYLKKYFEYNIISEEEESINSFSTFNSPIWIIDPLDGSLNFNRGIPISCISVALWDDGPIYGCIYDFNTGMLYVSNNGLCRINNNIANTSTIKDISSGVICTGFPSWRNYESSSLLLFIDKIKKWKKIRLLGSAAISLAWVAIGIVDAYIEEDIRIWDVAAGLALVKASGGEIYIKENDRTNFVTAIATNGKISIGDLK